MNQNVVIYDTNALLEYNQLMFWVSHSHSYFKSKGYKPVIPKNIEFETQNHLKKQTKNQIGLPYLRKGFSLEKLLLDDVLSVQPSRSNLKEIEYTEKGVEHYDAKLKKKEALDIADKDILSLVDDLMFENNNIKIAILSGDLKLSQVLRTISYKYNKDNIQIINPYERKWFQNISFRNNPFIFSLDVIQELHNNLLTSSYLRVHPNKIKIGNSLFHYVYGVYSSRIEKIGSEDILFQGNGLNMETITRGGNVLQTTPGNQPLLYTISKNIPNRFIKTLKKGSKSSKKNTFEKNLKTVMSNYVTISSIISISPEQLKILGY